MKKDTKHFKDLLTKEVVELEKQLQMLGRKNPDEVGDWETVRKNGIDKADEGDVAEGLEEYENNNAILGQLEIRLSNIKEAISRIENDTYGKCSVCGNDIEEDRLEASPEANTCKLHMS